MNIRFARIIDFYIGVPLCFIFSLFSSFRRKSSNDKCLIIALSEMGSIVLAHSFLLKLKDKFGSGNLYFLTMKRNKEAILLHNIIPENNFFLINDKGIFQFIFSAISLPFKLWKLKLKVTFDLELFSRVSSIFSFLSFSLDKVSFFKYTTEGLYKGTFQTHKVQYNPYIHIGSNFLNLANTYLHNKNNIPNFKSEIDPTPLKLPPIKITEEEKEKIINKIRKINPNISIKSKIIVINAAGGELPIRAWSQENYNLLIEMILKETNYFIIFAGVRKDLKELDTLLKAQKDPRVINFIGETKDLTELFSLLELSDIALSSDSGFAHFASLTNIKNFVFFGPETPILYGPLSHNSKVFYNNKFACSPCLTASNHRSTSCDGKNFCLNKFTPKLVFDSIFKGIDIK